ncbi:hypothetical protein UFOVP777_1, partial [uncultured Caudovirales phage]
LASPMRASTLPRGKSVTPTTLTLQPMSSSSSKPKRDYSKWVNKGCPKHKFAHQWHEDSSLCLHPQCLKGLILKLCDRNPNMKTRWMVFQAKGLDQDFVQHVAYYLLTKPEVKSLNMEQLRFAADRFTEQAYRPSDEYHTNYSHNFRSQPQLDHCTEETREEILEHGVRYVTQRNDPFLAVVLHEISSYIDNPELMLFASGQIDALDLALLIAPTADEVIDMSLQLEKVKPWLAEWINQYVKT